MYSVSQRSGTVQVFKWNMRPWIIEYVFPNVKEHSLWRTEWLWRDDGMGGFESGRGKDDERESGVWSRKKLVKTDDGCLTNNTNNVDITLQNTVWIGYKNPSYQQWMFSECIDDEPICLNSLCFTGSVVNVVYFWCPVTVMCPVHIFIRFTFIK